MSEEKQIEMFPVFDTLDRLMREGFNIEYPAQWEDVDRDLFNLVDITGGTVISGNSFRELCVNIVLAGL
jgi:hypothetical protein